MSNGKIDFQDVLQLVELIKSSSNFSEIHLRTGNLEVELRRNDRSPLEIASANRLFPAAPSESPVVNHHSGDEAKSARSAPVEIAPRVLTEGLSVVKSPMVGTVYHAPEPGAKPFVSVGQSVSPGDQICIIEVMKLMTAIKAEWHGVIVEVLVADAEMVEYGQELFVISGP